LFDLDAGESTWIKETNGLLPPPNRLHASIPLFAYASRPPVLSKGRRQIWSWWLAQFSKNTSPSSLLKRTPHRLELGGYRQVYDFTYSPGSNAKV